MLMPRTKSAILNLLQILVDKTPGVRQATVHTETGWPMICWPKRAIRAASTSFAVPKLLRRAGEFDRMVSVGKADCIVTELSGKTLLVLPFDDMCLTVEVSKDCELGPIILEISPTVDSIARLLKTASHSENEG